MLVVLGVAAAVTVLDAEVTGTSVPLDSVSGHTVVLTGTTTVTVVGVAVRGQFVIDAGHLEIVRTVVL